MNTSLIVFGLKNCDTTRKALKWLNENNIGSTFSDVRESPPTVEMLLAAMESGMDSKRLWNTSGAVYREGNYKEKAKHMTDTEMATVLAKNPMLLKRPFVVGSEIALVGFVESEFQSMLHEGN